jgi:hypothetical protein
VTLLDLYLQDHHAGAVAGVELARRAAKSNRGNAYGPDLEAITTEIEEDLRELERVMDQLQVPRAKLKDTAAWVAERLGRLKRNGTWLSYSPLSRMIELEGLILGVTGKLGLWEALGSSAAAVSDASDLERLASRARDQRSRLDRLRLNAAAEALGEAVATAASEDSD